MEEYNKKNPRDKIPQDYFKDILKMPKNGKFVEKLARFGDPREFSMPIPSKLD